jgi:pyruvate dehydrogenase E2 component (dihydrolipoamide acetyltransferase)
MFGIDAFTPILNLPECAVLGVGRIQPQPAVVDDQVVIRQKLWLSLTFDHRLIDGGPAARFLQRVAQLIENPPQVDRYGHSVCSDDTQQAQRVPGRAVL